MHIASHAPLPTANQVGRMDLVGDVAGCDVIMVDDMIDTAGTLTMAAHELKTMGARRIFAFATHGLFSGAGSERIEKSDLERVIVCNTVPLNPNKQVREICVLCVSCYVVADVNGAIL